MFAIRCLVAGLLATAVASPTSASTSTSAEIEGVRFAGRVDRSGTALALNGVGLLRYKFFIKGYVAALYLGDEVRVDEALADVPRRLEIEYFWAISAEKFVRATREGISRSVDEATLQRLSGDIAQLNGLYRDGEPGDRYALTYLPGVGTELALNGEPLGVVEGRELAAALFGIWIGDRALDASLREQLLSSR